MNLLLKKFKKKILYGFLIGILLIPVFFNPAFRHPFLFVLKKPLGIFTLLRRELGAMIYFHRNFIQNERLKKEIDLLRFKLNKLEELYLEEGRVRNLVSFKNESDLRLILSRVIARSADSWHSVVLIDKGSNHAIRPGMSVITHLGLAGRVVEVNKTTSKIRLINDANIGVSTLVQRSRQEGLISGTLGNRLILKYLGKSPDIKLNDRIITSGLNQTYPKGILIGTVIDIREDFSATSIYAIVEPAVDLSKIEEVLIVVP
ncbi:MAG: rod shape-determining protein MreC [Candidatus Omnitrophica bacterium]|nr:rod shape-determining protein MreC [Candidatus Omnitrophota bacterium]